MSKVISSRRATQLEYPYSRIFISRDEIKEMFYNLRFSYITYVNVDSFNVPLLRLGKEDTSNKVILNYTLYPSYTLTDYFTDNVRVQGKRYNERLTPLEYWNRNRGNLVSQVSHKGRCNLEDLYELIYSRVKGCTNFQPSLAYSTIRHYCAYSVLDISAGWGDRLIGAIAAGARYVACDPNKNLKIGHDAIIGNFAPYNRENYTIIYEPFEKATLPDEKFDLILTSPPYFDAETYSNDPSQSIKKYNSLKSWMNNFLFASLEKAWNCLRVGGHMVVHINDSPNGAKYVIKMKERVNTFPMAKFLGVYGKVDSLEKEELARARPVWIWHKKR